MITVQTTITPQQITRSLAGDWAPTWRRWAGAAAAVLAAVYCAGLVTGARWRQLLAWARRHHLQGLGRMGLPGGIPTIDVPVQSVMIIQRCAAAPRALPAVAPPRVSAIHLLAADGLSQRQIARQLGISRHRVKAALEVAA